MAGWFDFVNGQTLPASRVQDYLMDQSVMVFDDAAARTAALPSPTNGMVTYLLSPGELYVRTSTAWVKVIDNNNLVNSLPRARNLLINGSLEINQRNFISTTANGTYGFDRWFLRSNDTLATYSTQAFAVGDLEVAGAVPRNFARIVTTGQTAANTLTILRQLVEGVRNLAGKTVTFSFWAKAATGTPKINVSLTQNFGGGSANVETVALPATITTTWARYSFTINLPTIVGKTIGSAGNDHIGASIFVSAGTDYPAVGFGIQSNTFDIWGVQLEESPVATPFVRAATTLQGELAACQRYYYRSTSDATNRFKVYGQGQGANATAVQAQIQFPVPLRIAPSAVEFSTLRVADGVASISVSALAMNSTQQSESIGFVTATVSGATGYRPYVLQANDSTSSFIGFSAEL